MGNVRNELMDLIDRRAFEPVLKKSPQGYSERDREKLEDLKKTTKSTQQRYHAENDAESLRGRFRDDLHSDAAKKVHGELRSLGLPTLPDIEDEFEQKYRAAQEGH